MAKSKTIKASKPEQSKAVSSVKGSGVVKSSQTPKSKSKEVAKAVASKAQKAGKTGKKSKKEATPPSSESESDDAETSDSSASSDSDSDAGAPVPKPNGAAKVNGKANGKASKQKAVSSSEEESGSSDEESEEEKPAAKGVAKATSKTNDSTIKKTNDSDSDSSDEDSDEEDVPVKAATSKDSDEDSSDASSSSETEGKAKVAKISGKAADLKDKAGSSDEEDDSEDEGSDADSSDESDAEEAPTSKKRKAEVESTPVAKKAKADPATPSTPANAQKNLFVGNLSWNVDEEWLKTEFESYGSIAGVRIVTDRDSGRSKGFGYVEYENIEDAVKAHDAMKEAAIDGRPINLDYSIPRQQGERGGPNSQRAKKFGDQLSEPSSTIFVGNIAFEATQDMIGELFSQHGEVSSVRLPTDMNSGAPKGFGYVEFTDVEGAKTALGALAGAELAGRALRLDYSTPRGDSGGSPRGRGGRGGGRGDRGGRGGGRGRGGDRGGRGGRGGFSTNRGGFGDFKGKKMTF